MSPMKSNLFRKIRRRCSLEEAHSFLSGHRMHIFQIELPYITDQKSHLELDVMANDSEQVSSSLFSFPGKGYPFILNWSARVTLAELPEQDVCSVFGVDSGAEVLRRTLRRAPALRATPYRLLSSNLATLIAVDSKDNVVGSIDTKDAHSWTQIQRGGSLHRAFSVFLFNSNGDMLIQKRAAKKLLFPGMWSNTCCSHPLYNDEELANDPPFIGIKRAAQRKMSQEFSIPPLPLDSFHCVTRILYKAQYSEDLGEHELDYIIFTRSDLVPLPNLDEVEMTQYVSESQLKSLLELSQKNEKAMSFSPWFRMMADKLLPSWWKQLGDMSTLKDMDSIHELTLDSQ